MKTQAIVKDLVKALKNIPEDSEVVIKDSSGKPFRFDFKVIRETKVSDGKETNTNVLEFTYYIDDSGNFWGR